MLQYNWYRVIIRGVPRLHALSPSALFSFTYTYTYCWFHTHCISHLQILRSEFLFPKDLNLTKPVQLEVLQTGLGVLAVGHKQVNEASRTSNVMGGNLKTDSSFVCPSNNTCKWIYLASSIIQKTLFSNHSVLKYRPRITHLTALSVLELPLTSAMIPNPSPGTPSYSIPTMPSTSPRPMTHVSA